MALALPPSSARVFSLVYEPPAGILRGTWAGPGPSAELPACYGQLLAAAHAHGNCRFWLLHLQQRNWHSKAVGQWFNEDFVPRAVAVLGAPLFLACVVHPSQRPLVEASRTEQLLRRAAAHNVFPFYFENETDARAWLGYQQAGEQAGGAQPRAHALMS